MFNLLMLFIVAVPLLSLDYRRPAFSCKWKTMSGSIMASYGPFDLFTFLAMFGPMQITALSSLGHLRTFSILMIEKQGIVSAPAHFTRGLKSNVSRLANT